MRTAAYVRYSSDSQRDASLDDQLRNVRTFCDRHGWSAPVVYADAAISGSREDRPKYRALLADAGSGRFDVILVDDLSRLSRDKDECGKAIKRLIFAGVRVIGVSDGVDTASKGHKVNAGLRGLMSELYLDDLAEKTHRGLTGRALAGASAGGLPFGYRTAGIGQRVIDEAQAGVVKRIYAEFILGRTPREIANDLNADRTPPARGSTWCMTAIYGDTRRGIGILANPIYVGRQIWNRSRWTKHPDTGRRIRKERPESEWIISEHPELAIIDQPTWQAAQARLGATRSQTQQRRQDNPRAGPGRAPRHLLSGLLRCQACGGPLVVVDRYRYGCSTHKDRGQAACPSRLRIPKASADAALLSQVKTNLLSEAAFKDFERAAAAELKQSAPDLHALRARAAAAESARTNIMNALRAGIITASTRAELIATEAECAAATEAIKSAANIQPAQFLPRAREIWRRIVRDLENENEVPRMRAALTDLLGDKIVVRQENGEIFAELGLSKINVVAGAGSVLYLTEPLRIHIPTVKPSRG